MNERFPLRSQVYGVAGVVYKVLTLNISMFRRSLKEPPPEEQPFPVRGYVIINLLFYLFLLLVFWAAWFVQNGEVTGMMPVLGALAVLFTLVSVYDGVFDRVIYRRHLREKKRVSAGEGEARTDSQSGGGSATGGARDGPTPSGVRPAPSE